MCTHKAGESEAYSLGIVAVTQWLVYMLLIFLRAWVTLRAGARGICHTQIWPPLRQGPLSTRL